MESEVIAWPRAQEPSRLDCVWHLQKAFERRDRPECPVGPRFGIQENTSHYPVSAFHLHELPADLCQTRLPHLGHVYDPGQQCAIGQFLTALLAELCSTGPALIACQEFACQGFWLQKSDLKMPILHRAQFRHKSPGISAPPPADSDCTKNLVDLT
jgi:hypothetical protein